MFYVIASLIVRGLMRLFTRLEVVGAENVPLDGSLVVVSNHLHNVDGPLLGALLPRKVIFMAKSEIFRAFPLGLLVRAYESFGVNRGQGDTGAIRKAIKVVERRQVLGIFPEGHRSRDGRLQPAHLGAAMIALRTGAPILPVGITGTRAILRWSGLTRPRVVVRIGAPFQPDRAALSSREQQIELTNTIMCRIAELLPPDQRGIFGEDAAQAAEPEAKRRRIIANSVRLRHSRKTAS